MTVDCLTCVQLAQDNLRPRGGTIGKACQNASHAGKSIILCSVTSSSESMINMRTGFQCLPRSTAAPLQEARYCGTETNASPTIRASYTCILMPIDEVQFLVVWTTEASCRFIEKIGVHARHSSGGVPFPTYFVDFSRCVVGSLKAVLVSKNKHIDPTRLPHPLPMWTCARRKNYGEGRQPRSATAAVSRAGGPTRCQSRYTLHPTDVHNGSIRSLSP